MPWVRIDENAMEHPKIGGLPDGAFRLWVQALAYCQKFLTDGVVNAVALKGLRAYSAQRCSVLMAAGLWKRATDGSVHVHDFLDWNDSKALVLQARQDSKERRRRWRERHASPDAVPGASPDGVPGVSSDACGTPSGVRGVVCTYKERSSKLREEGVGETNDAGLRVRWFLDRYRDFHQEYVGVAYMGNSQTDYREACALVEAFDDATLEKLTVYWLNDRDTFATDGTRTLAKFRSRASKYAEELKAKRLA